MNKKTLIPLIIIFVLAGILTIGSFIFIYRLSFFGYGDLIDPINDMRNNNPESANISLSNFSNMAKTY
jgi:hypothetical protein